MARFKNTKNELKAQRDALRRYERYLPTLQLKKQQLQLEVRLVEHRLEENVTAERLAVESVANWVGLFGESIDFGRWLAVERLVLDETNVAGVTIPVLRDVEFTRSMPDLFATDPWLDDALDVLSSLARLRLQRRILERQRELLSAELVITNQRVNLFERVKIPECKEVIRRVRIFLGDMQTLDVARGKIAKRKALERETASCSHR